MPKKPPPALRISGPARRDVIAILRWSTQHFGVAAASRYEALMTQALLDIRTDPMRAGSKARPELMIQGARTYHLYFSRNHVSGGSVKEPRHFLLYRVCPDGAVEVGRILHDSRDLQRHLPDTYKLAE